MEAALPGLLLCWRDEEIETAARHIRNLCRAPRASAEFRSGGAAVNVRLDLLWIGVRAVVLAGHLLNSFIRNSESQRERLFSRYQHDTNRNTNKSGGSERTRTNGDEHRCTRKSSFFKGLKRCADGYERSRTSTNNLVGAPGRNRTTLRSPRSHANICCKKPRRLRSRDFSNAS